MERSKIIELIFELITPHSVLGVRCSLRNLLFRFRVHGVRATVCNLASISPCVSGREPGGVRERRRGCLCLLIVPRPC